MRSLVEKNLGCPTVQQDLPTQFKKRRYFYLSMAAILLSLVFSVAKYQLLTLSIITGIKWIADSKKTGIIIIERR